MSIASFTDVDRSGPRPSAVPYQEDRDQHTRILDVLGLTGDRLPYVDQDNLSRYYEYLSANLHLPLEVCYPEPKTPREEMVYECTVLELLNPSKYLGDEFDGIFCRTWRAGFEVNLPLVELEVPQDSPNFQMIEDYWYWFWNWRCP
jgi:hypothetical protein